jgi:predicted lipid-binding transport protein (Tim44 family)
MKAFAGLLVVLLTLTFASLDADAARRFGGGSNLGKQRPAPTMKEAQPSTAPQAPTQAAKPAQQPSPTATPTAPPPKPSFMSRFGGLLAGLGIGALLGSLFGGHLGGMGGLLMLVLLAAVLFMAYRAFAARRNGASGFEPALAGPAMRETEPEPASRPVFSGIGSGIPTGDAAAPAPRTYETELSSPLPADFDREAFLRVAKTSFIRLQAANDAKDLDDIRDYTTPEMYAEIAMQLADRGVEPQKTEVVSLEAQLYDYAVEGDYEIASVRFHGLIRDTPSGNPEPFDEIWHVRKKHAEARAPWLIAGIQQA